MNNRKTIDSDTIAKVIEMYLNGAESIDIASECNISRSSVYYILKGENIPRNRRKTLSW